MALADAEPTDFWTEFLRYLRDLGLKVATDPDPLGVTLLTSDAHAGLKAAVKATLPGSGWQRCRVHFARNVTHKLGSAGSKPVNALISTIFAQTMTEAVTAQYQAVTDSFRGSFPEIAAMLEAEADLTGFAPLPREHWQKVWSKTPSNVSTGRSNGASTSSRPFPTATPSPAASALFCRNSTRNGASLSQR